MNNLKRLAVEFLPANVQTLVKAGYLSGELVLTKHGRWALNAILVKQNLNALVASAEADLDSAVETETSSDEE